MSHSQSGQVSTPANQPAPSDGPAGGAVPVHWRRGAFALLYALIAFKLVLLVVLAWNSKFLMDEYWLVGRVWLFSTDLYQDVFPPKTLLYAAFYQLAHWLGDGAVGVMQVARLQAAAVSVLGLGLLYAIGRRIGHSRLEALFAVFAVLAFATYMERAFTTRPEAPATFLALAALYLAIRGEGAVRVVFGAGLLSGLAFLFMQKSVYFNLALGLALVGDGLARRSLRDAFIAGAVLVLGWALVVLAYGAYFTATGAAFGDVLMQVFTGSTGNALGGHTVYENLRIYLIQTLARNPAQYLLCLAGWLLVLPRLRSTPQATRMAWIFSGVIAVLVFTHPAPWPYNFIMALPFLGLWAPLVAQALARRDPGRSALILAGLTLALALSLTRNVGYLDNHNGAQNETLRTAERLLAPGDSYADGIGMVVTRRRAGRQDWWARFGILRILDDAKRGEFERIDLVFADSPKLWILNYRTDALAGVLKPYFENAYVPIFPNILITGLELLPGRDATFQTRWPGRYRLYRANGTPAEAPVVVDGRTITGGVELEKGRHSLRLADVEGSLYLLPADIPVPFDLTRPLEREPLYDNVYTF